MVLKKNTTDTRQQKSGAGSNQLPLPCLTLAVALGLAILLNGCSSSGSDNKDSGTNSAPPPISMDQPPSPPNDDNPVVAAITKATGSFSTNATEAAVIDNNVSVGALVRVRWAELEPSPGQYQFDRLNEQLVQVDAVNKDWSLAIQGSTDSPAWLINDSCTLETQNTELPQALPFPCFWDPQVQAAIANLASTLGNQYADHPRLRLVYVTQMGAESIEGHFNGVSETDLLAAGYSEQNWIEAAITSARNFATAFPTQAIAIEVHEILGSTTPAEQILYRLWEDPVLEQRVGAGMWWLSGREDYQADLLKLLEDFPGDIYAQAIGRSDQPERFGNNDYHSLFEQAKQLGVRSIEGWEFEFRENTHNEAFLDFNRWSETTFLP